MTGLADRSARERAQQDFEHNLVITAGAGTGKTSLLTGRTIAALLFEKIEAEKILITTFTEKAAAEMFERAEQALLSIADGNPNADAMRCIEAREADPQDPGLQSRASELVDQDHLPSISTFHAFCLGLIREHAKTLEFSPLARVRDEEERREEFETVWHGFLQSELGTLPLPSGTVLSEEEWREVLALPGLTPLKALVWNYLELSPEKGIRWDEGVEELQAAAQEILADHAEFLDRHCTEQAPKPRAFLSKARALLAELVEHDLSLDMPETWTARSEELAKQGMPGPSTSKALKAESQAVKALGRQLHAITKGIYIHLTRVDTTSLRKICQSFQERWRRHCAREGILSHNDCLGLAHELLRDHPSLCRSLGEGYRQILVDEFQDTDPLQYEILFLLGRDWKRSEQDPTALREGLFCIVGDPKQSIYRFRGADMTTFELALQRMTRGSGARLDLSVNFRSTAEVLDFVNETMEGLILPEPGVQPDYVPLDAPPLPRPAQGPTAELQHLVFDPDMGDKRRQEARMLASEVRALAESRPGLPDGQPAWRDIVYLFRASTDADLYAHELREAGIPVLLEGSRKFYTRHEIERFLAFLRALIRPHDEAALVGWLRSPMVAAKDSELLAFIEDGGSWEDFYREDAPDSLPAVLAAARADLDRLRSEIRNLSAHDSLAHLFHDGVLSPIEAAGYGGQQAWANLERLVHIVGQWSQERSLDLGEALDRLEEDSLTEKTMEESPLADPGLNAVRLLTAHSSKGLQWPVVVLPDLSHGTKNTRDAKDFVLVRDQDGSRLLLDREPFQSPLLELHLLREAGHEKAERMRLLYVAMTRAEDRLLLSYCDKSKGAKFASQPWAQAFEPYGFHAKNLLEDGKTLGRHLIYRRATSLPHQKREKREGAPPALLAQRVEAWHSAKDQAHAQLRPAFHAPSHHASDSAGHEGAAPVHTRTEEGGAAELGTLIHAYLACMGQGEADLKEERLQALAPHDAARRDAAAEILRVFLRSPLADRFSQVRILGRELPLLYRDPQGSRWQGSMDLVIEEDGEIIVVDFKSDRVGSAQIDERAAFYESQLSLYAHALQEAWQLAELPQRELWFLRPCRAHRYPPG